MTQSDYIQNSIKAALANGLTMDQIKANPVKVMEAYHESRMRSIEAAGKLHLRIQQESNK